MKALRSTVLICLGLLIFWHPPVLPALETGPEATIAKIRDYVLNPNFDCHGIERTLVEALDVSLVLLPRKDYSAEYRSRVEWVKSSFAEKRLFSDKIRQYLGLSYKLVAGGAAWQLPEEVKAAPSSGKGIKAALDACGRFLDSALAEMKSGNNEKAVRHILDFVILVITPIEA